MSAPATLRTVRLFGHLAEGVGDTLELVFKTPAEALRLIEVNFPGFIKRFKEGRYFVTAVRGKRERDLPADRLTLGFTGEELHIMPEAVGAKKGKGLLMAIIGGLIIGAAFFLSGGTLATVLPGLFGLTGSTYGTLATMGAGLILQGVGILLTPSMKANKAEEEKQSYVFNGPVNVTEQGGVLGLVFGKMMVGTVVVSASLDVEMLLGDPLDNEVSNPAVHLPYYRVYPVITTPRDPDTPLAGGRGNVVDMLDLLSLPTGFSVTHASLDGAAKVAIGTFPTFSGTVKTIAGAGAVTFYVNPSAQTDTVQVIWNAGFSAKRGYTSKLNLTLTNGPVVSETVVTATLGNYSDAPGANVGYTNTNDGNGNFTTTDVGGR
jgi:predicted phage tail protein